MADDISSPNWSETAASNTTAGATGWAANSAPTSAYTVMRDKMAAIKRWYDRTNPTVTSAGTNTVTLTYSVTPNAYLQGDPYCFVVGGTNTGPATLNVNGLGAKAITKNGTAALSGGEMLIGAVVTCLYDGTQFQLTDGILAGTFVGGTLSATTAMSAVAFNEADAGNISSSATVNIGAAAGNTMTITGTTGITAFDTVQAGTLRFLKFSGILTWTHNGTSMILPNGGNNITTASGDNALVESLGSGNWRCLIYQKASGSTGANAPVTTKTADYTLVAADNGGTFVMNSASAHIFTLPDDATAGNGWNVQIINQGAGVLSVTRAGTDTIGSGGSVALTTIALSQGDQGTITADGVSHGIFWFTGARHFDSGQQTITSAGALTLAHGLGVQPPDIQMVLHCTTGEFNYSIGNELSMPANIFMADTSGINGGVSTIGDATNLTVRYGSNTSVFAVPNATTGAQAGLTNGSWKAIFRAWVYN